MLSKIERVGIAVVAGAVGLMAVIPGWQIMTDGSVYGFKLPPSWLSGWWPFEGYFVAGLVLLVVVAGGCLATAVIDVFDRDAGAIAGLVMGVVLVGWIAGELLFMTQTMFLTWVILGSGVVMAILAAPVALPLLRGGRRSARAAVR